MIYHDISQLDGFKHVKKTPIAAVLYSFFFFLNGDPGMISPISSHIKRASHDKLPSGKLENHQFLVETNLPTPR